MNQFHKPTDEKRMVVVLTEAAYDDWLTATAENSGGLLLPCATDVLRAEG
jgi:putative SOS response-associated peptidase YedK